MTTPIPADGYPSNSSRTVSDMQTFVENILSFIKEGTSGTGEQSSTQLSSHTFTPASTTTSGDPGNGDNACWYKIDTQSMASSDLLQNVSVSNLRDGQLIGLRITSLARVITAVNNAGGAGQLFLANGTNFLMNNTKQFLLLKFNLAINAFEEITSSQINFRGLSPYNDFMEDCIISGFQTAVPGSASLSGTMSTGANGYAEAIALGQQVQIASSDARLTYTYTASQDTYNDLSYNGTVTHTAVSNGGTPPALTANSIRLEKVVTNASTITTVQTYGQSTTSGGATQLAAAGFAPNVATLNTPQINQTQTASILPGLSIQNQGPLANNPDFLADWLITGYAPPSLPTSGLSCTFTGNANGITLLTSQSNRVAIANGDARLTHTYTASQDTYVDVDNTGAFHYSAVSNGGTAPALYSSSSMRLAKVVSGASTVTGVTILAQQLPPYKGQILCQGRLYAGGSSTPYADTTSSGSSTLYFGPDSRFGSTISLSTSSSALQLQNYVFAQASYTVSGLTAGDIYDVYVQWSATACALTISNLVAWTGTGSFTPPSRTLGADGRLYKSGDYTQLWVGVVYANSATTVIDWSGLRGISNVFNQISKIFYANDTTTTWTGTSTTPLTLHGSTTNGTARVTWVDALGANAVNLELRGLVSNSTGGTANDLGIALDSTSVLGALAYSDITVAGAAAAPSAAVAAAQGVGLHYAQLMYQISSGTATFYGTNSGNHDTYLTGSILC